MTDANTSLLILRAGLGLMLMAHGANKVFGSGGIEGTERYFTRLGLRPVWLHARLAAATEVGAGLLMMLGAFAPIASAAIVGLMTVAAFTDHRGRGFFVFAGGWEYVAFVGLVAVCIAVAGPGEWSIDASLPWQMHGLGWAGLAVAAAFAGAAVLLTIGRGGSEDAQT